MRLRARARRAPVSGTCSRIATFDKVSRLVARLARDFPKEREACPVGSDRALDHALITQPAARDPALVAKLDAVAGRVLKGVE